ncbi:MAG: hypothetical protein ACK5JF_10765 [Oscillospiraceae bacterium]
MSLRKRTFLRIISGVVLLAISMMLTFIIKEVLSARNPEGALPTMQVAVGGTILPNQYTDLFSYSWRFLTSPIESGKTQEDLAALPAAPVNPGDPIQFRFSYDASSVKISRAVEGSNVFYEVAASSTEDGVGILYTPEVAGIYTYQVQASWWLRGSVEYYFRISVQDTSRSA